jgi:hypothetical protein
LVEQGEYVSPTTKNVKNSFVLLIFVVILESKYWNMAPVKIQIKFAKFLIGVNKAAVNAAVLAELGMYPVSIQALKLSISFWLHVLNSGENSLVSTAYKASLLLPNGFAKKNYFYPH